MTAEAVQRVYIDAGIAEGTELVVDGRETTVDGHENGFFLGGCLFDRVTSEMRIYRVEIFGDLPPPAAKIASMSRPAAMAKEAVNRAFEAGLSEGTARSVAPLASIIAGQVLCEAIDVSVEWARWDSNPHWHGPKPCASANWATGPTRSA